VRAFFIPWDGFLFKDWPEALTMPRRTTLLLTDVQRRLGPILIVSVVLLTPIGVVSGQQATPGRSAQAPQIEPVERRDLDRQVARLESRVDRLESRTRDRSAAGIAFLFGAFCALWAQNTKRNPWAWFFLGAFFNVITVLVLLAKNGEDPETATGMPPVVIAAIMGGVLLFGFLMFWLLR
jgi:hypothetical protein